MPNLQVGDIGTVIEITVTDDGALFDISGADTLIITLVKPLSGDKVQALSASFVTDGTDGKIKLVTVADDLDEAGLYEVQVQIGFPSGVIHKSNVDSLVVHPNIF